MSQKPGKKIKKSKSIVSRRERHVDEPTVWGIRLSNAEKVKLHYKEYAYKLLMQNETLQSQICQIEWDTIEVLNYLKNQDNKKGNTIDELQKQCNTLQKKFEKEITELTADFQTQLSNLDDQLKAKIQENDSLHNELRQVQSIIDERKEFEREIKELKEVLSESNKKHQKILDNVERNFFEQRFKYEDEMNKKNFKLRREARQEAIKNLNDITKQVYHENSQLSDSLLNHIREIEILTESNSKYVKKFEFAKQELAEQKLLLIKKIKELDKFKREHKKLLDRVKELEKSYTDTVERFTVAKNNLVLECQRETEDSRQVIVNLREQLRTQDREMTHIRNLAQRVLEQRNELEMFFIDGLNFVRNSIIQSREEFMKQSKLKYHSKMLGACRGNAPYPEVKTFRKVNTSTNSIYTDFMAAKFIDCQHKKINVADMTWEQKEKVLCYLFSKMNESDKGQSDSSMALYDHQKCLLSKGRPKKLLPISPGSKKPLFLTQM